MTAAAAIVASGFFSSSSVRTALAVGAAVALVSAPLGVFTVIRSQSFAGEALGDTGTTGGAGGFLVGVGPLWGFLVINVAAGALMELLGVQRSRGRDLATGVVLGAGLGLAALFFYLDSTLHNTSGAPITVLFGSLFTVESSTLPLVLVFGVLVLAVLAVIARPLLLASTSPELAAARGVRVGLVGFAYLLSLSLSVALCAITIGSILSTALLIGPAAASLRIARRPGRAIVLAAGLGVAATWLGVLLAYDSFEWSASHPWPVSFFVVALVFVEYLLCGLVGSRHRAHPTVLDTAPPATLGG
ncbi:MAG TPA: metal ABC transporter permease [Solirubrobacteraceae bacterium]|nr:metal ABC transporter permease [Solirubrobacteraceae bacterium]